MRVAVGSDHRGFQLKQRILQILTDAGHEVEDVGTKEAQSVDYPDYAVVVARKVSDGTIDRGILICGTGIGMAIAANKFPNVRATTANDETTAEMCRRHNNVNVLCLSGDMLGEGPVESLIRTWMETEFEGGRHQRRLDKIRDVEQEFSS